MGELRFLSASKTYPTGVRAVAGVSLTVPHGDTVAIVGPSGGGKTTLLRLAAGLEEPTGGEVLLDGRVVNTIPPPERRVAVAFQVPALYPHLTVRENLGFALRYQSVAGEEGEARVTAAAGALEIADVLDRAPQELSGGQRQRVALGRCLVSRARVLLLDEPLAQLDVPLRAAVRVVLANHFIAFGTTVLWVTHDPAEARSVSKRVIEMRDGKATEMMAGVRGENTPAG
jgi:ABC-type sugar transport system ATPase subunit